jgi:hypothetical protein
MRILAALAVSFLILSGCAAKTPTIASHPEPPKAKLDPTAVAGADTGVVQGHVRSDDLLPIAGAIVGLTQSGPEDKTDEAGLFVLRDIAPGKHVLVAQRLGYGSVARSVQVVAGQVATLEITLKAMEVPKEVYSETVQTPGYLECGFGMAAFAAPCTYPYRLVHGNAMKYGVNLTNYGFAPDLHPNRFWLNITVKPGADQLVAEMVWRAGSAAAQTMRLFILCGDFDPTLNECTQGIRYGNGNGFAGTSPVRVTIDAKEFRTKGCPASKFCLKDKPIWVANDVALPWATPPQVAFQQKVEVWDTVFYNGPGPDGFTVLPDQ